MALGLVLNTPDGKRTVAFGGNQVEKRADLAVIITEINARWSTLEAFAGCLLGVMMATDPVVATALLKKHSTATAKKQAILEVGKAVLSGKDLENLKSLMKEFEDTGNARNDIAHGLWGVDEDRPDELAWADPTIVPFLGLHMTEAIGSGADMTGALTKRMDEIVFYNKDKLSGIVTDIQTVSDHLMGFMEPLMKERAKRRFPQAYREGEGGMAYVQGPAPDPR